VHKAVKNKVKPVRWAVFWRVVIEGESIREAADALGLKYTTAFASAKRVASLLREEGMRRADSRSLDDSPESGRQQ
jgi:hypothetical protein